MNSINKKLVPQETDSTVDSSASQVEELPLHICKI